MDPRYRRSREKLRAAIYALASQKPVTEIQVIELCHRAGITKDTFYRHASSPVALLADVLGEEVRETAERYEDLAGDSTLDGNMGRAARLLLEHVRSHRTVYLNAMQPRLLDALREELETVADRALTRHLACHPEILPAGIMPADAESARVLVVYAAAGLARAVEAWLGAGSDDLDRGVRDLLAAMPEWWFTARRADGQAQDSA